MSIETSLREALLQLQNEKFLAAMTSACISLDATAKNEFGTKSERRCRQFVQANLDIITLVGLGGALLVAPGATLKLKQPESPTSCISVEDILYKSIRCHLVHEAALPKNVTFTKDAFYGERSGIFQIPVLMIYAVILSVIGSPTNSTRSLGMDMVMMVNGKQLILDQLWGKADVIRQILGITPMSDLTDLSSSA
jgi:hypothetical protein